MNKKQKRNEIMKIIPMILMLAFATQISAGGSSCGVSGSEDTTTMLGAGGSGTWTGTSSSS
jgi:hypothetical protein